MTARTDEKIISTIISLRQKGKSILEIRDQLSVPKTTVFRYIKNVSILPEYEKEWLGKRGGSMKRKLKAEKKAYDEAQEIVGSVSSKELLLYISALYWAEGSKSDFSLSNTDPMLVKTFIRGLMDVLGVKKEDFRIHIRTYEDLDREKCIKHWLQVTRLDREQIISVNVLYGKKTGKLEYGMCRVRVKKAGDILKKLKAINMAVVNALANKVDIL